MTQHKRKKRGSTKIKLEDHAKFLAKDDRFFWELEIKLKNKAQGFTPELITIKLKYDSELNHY